LKLKKEQKRTSCGNKWSFSIIGRLNSVPLILLYTALYNIYNKNTQQNEWNVYHKQYFRYNISEIQLMIWFYTSENYILVWQKMHLISGRNYCKDNSNWKNLTNYNWFEVVELIARQVISIYLWSITRFVFNYDV